MALRNLIVLAALSILAGCAVSPNSEKQSRVGEDEFCDRLGDMTYEKFMARVNELQAKRSTKTAADAERVAATRELANMQRCAELYARERR